MGIRPDALGRQREEGFCSLVGPAGGSIKDKCNKYFQKVEEMSCRKLLSFFNVLQRTKYQLVGDLLVDKILLNMRKNILTMGESL